MNRELLKQALDALEPDDSAYREERVDRAIGALKAELAKPDPEPVCSRHPDAPHGFDRNGSHTSGRHVCLCANWSPGEAS